MFTMSISRSPSHWYLTDGSMPVLPAQTCPLDWNVKCTLAVRVTS